MQEILKHLTDRDEKTAYELAKRIGSESSESDKYLNLVPAFAEMLQAKSSFVRARGFMLICNQSRWANEGQIEAVFDQMIPLLNDPKPTVVRQCLNALHEVVLFRPELSERIENALSAIDPGRYKDSMSPLIEKDLAALRKILDQNILFFDVRHKKCDFTGMLWDMRKFHGMNQLAKIIEN